MTLSFVYLPWIFVELSSIIDKSQSQVLVLVASEMETDEIAKDTLYIFDVCFFLLPMGSGPIPEVLQYRANPWRERSKPLTSRPVPKISLISKSPNGGRIRY